MAARHVLLLTDFDGTLADLAPIPSEAVMDDAVCGSFDRLATLPSVTVGVVSGRRLTDVGQRVGPAAQFVAGLHGLEITGPDCAFHHYALDAVAPMIETILRTATRELSWCPGLLLEDKTYALTCHVRLAPQDLGDRALEEFEAIAEPQLEARVLKSLNGARALELLPAVDWHKGRACEWIRARVRNVVDRPVSVVYLGDDRTDEDAFDALGDDDFVIGVGDRPHTHLIDRRLAGPGSVGRFFAALTSLRARP
ncbi:MAG TPA: trehalose-phosphatase [Vicinamibacterales bacterium]|nr:trehalose-phosphatase [Vicinamibacterales bacterium]